MYFGQAGPIYEARIPNARDTSVTAGGQFGRSLPGLTLADGQVTLLAAYLDAVPGGLGARWRMHSTHPAATCQSRGERYPCNVSAGGLNQIPGCRFKPAGDEILIGSEKSLNYGLSRHACVTLLRYDQGVVRYSFCTHIDEGEAHVNVPDVDYFRPFGLADL